MAALFASVDESTQQNVEHVNEEVAPQFVRAADQSEIEGYDLHAHGAEQLSSFENRRVYGGLDGRIAILLKHRHAAG